MLSRFARLDELLGLDLYVSLHTADPDDESRQTAFECAYTGYARLAVKRYTDWERTGYTLKIIRDVTFGACTGGSSIATHYGFGTAATGPGDLYYSGLLIPKIPISVGATPRVTPEAA
jgi:hypothetical protein